MRFSNPIVTAAASACCLLLVSQAGAVTKSKKKKGDNCVTVGNHVQCCQDDNSHHVPVEGGDYVCLCNPGYDISINVYDNSTSCTESDSGSGGGGGGGGVGGGGGDPGPGGGGGRDGTDACVKALNECLEKAEQDFAGFNGCVDRGKTITHMRHCKGPHLTIPGLGKTYVGDANYKCANGTFSGYKICDDYWLKGASPCQEDGINTQQVSLAGTFGVGFSGPSVGGSLGLTEIDHGTQPRTTPPPGGYIGRCEDNLMEDVNNCGAEYDQCKEEQAESRPSDGTTATLVLGGFHVRSN